MSSQPAGTAPNAAKRAASTDAFEFVRELATELSSSNIELPSFPEIAARVQKILADETATSDRVVRVLGAEPILATRVLTLANSAAMNTTGAPVTDLRAAVMRLGFDAMRSAVISFAMSQMRNARSFKEIERHLAILCQHAAVVASMCFVLARRSGKINPDTAMLTGLVHGVGKLYILTHATRHPALLGDQVMYQQIVRDWHANIAKALLESWNMADEIVGAVHSYEDDERDVRGLQGQLADILSMAEMVSVCKDAPQLLQERLKNNKASARMSLSLEGAQALVGESTTELAALRDALGS